MRRRISVLTLWGIVVSLNPFELASLAPNWKFDDARAGLGIKLQIANASRLPVRSELSATLSTTNRISGSQGARASVTATNGTTRFRKRAPKIESDVCLSMWRAGLWFISIGDHCGHQQIKMLRRDVKTVT